MVMVNTYSGLTVTASFKATMGVRVLPTKCGFSSFMGVNKPLLVVLVTIISVYDITFLFWRLDILGHGCLPMRQVVGRCKGFICVVGRVLAGRARLSFVVTLFISVDVPKTVRSVVRWLEKEPGSRAVF